MLSRVADSLYWTGPLHRAGRGHEPSPRTSNFHGLLDADLPDRRSAWRDLMRLARPGRRRSASTSTTYTAPAVTEFLLWHPANPDAVTACIDARARERARRARAGLERDVGAHEPAAPARLQHGGRAARCSPRPNDFFVRVREGSHAFQGVTKATQQRGEAYEFLELGAHLERADATAAAARDEGARAERRRAADRDERSGSRPAQVLRRVRGLPRGRRATSCAPDRVVAFLLLERRLRAGGLLLPRAEPERDQGDLRRRRAAGARDRPRLRRARVHASSTGSANRPSSCSSGSGAGIYDAADEIAAAYFTTRVIAPGPYAAAQQQQQQ